MPEDSTSYLAFFPFYRGLLITVQLISIIIISLLAPILLRYFCLPSLVHFSSPLHFIFTTCNDRMYGACSYPTATISLKQEDLKLSNGITYDVNIDIFFPDSTLIDGSLAFQVLFKASDEEGNVLSSLQRTVLMKHTSRSGWVKWVLTLVKKFIFLPLYIIGFFADSDDSIFRLSHAISVDSKSVSEFIVQVQDRNVQVKSGTFQLIARMGLFRRFLQNWPVISYLLMAAACIFLMSSALLCLWACERVLTYFKRCDNGPISVAEELGIEASFTRNKEQLSEISKNVQAKSLKPNENLDKISHRNQRELNDSNEFSKYSDECFLSDQEILDDEAPECPFITDIPGWTVIPESELRNRHKRDSTFILF